MFQISVLDTNWTGRPKSIAAALLESSGFRALIDPGPASTLSTLRQHLGSHGLQVSGLDAILLTHIHLDHAAVTGTLVRENPRLAVYVHERGAPHMADPSKLLASAGRLYGAEMEPLFGEFLAVPQENLRVLRGGEMLSLGSSELRVLYTPGHASHHVTYFDPTQGIAFVGDTAGICMEGDSYLLPATPPPDIDLELWNASLDAILALQPKRLFLTHFGYSNAPSAHIAAYRQCLNSWYGLVQQILARQPDEAAASREFVEATTQEIHGQLSDSDAEHYIFNGGLGLSFSGLSRCYRKQIASRSQ